MKNKSYAIMSVHGLPLEKFMKLSAGLENIKEIESDNFPGEFWMTGDLRLADTSLNFYTERYKKGVTE